MKIAQFYDKERIEGYYEKRYAPFSPSKEIPDKGQGLAYQNKRVFHGCAHSLLAAVQGVFGMADVVGKAARRGGGILLRDDLRH